MTAVLGKDSTVMLATDSRVVDLSPDYGGFTWEGTTRVISFAPAQRDSMRKIIDKVEYSFSLDSLRWSSDDAAPSLGLGDEFTCVHTLGANDFCSGVAQPVIIAARAITTPTDDLVDVSLTTDASGPPMVGTGQTAPTNTTAHTVDATGVRKWNVPSSGSNQTTRSNWARSPSNETRLHLLVLDVPVSNNAVFSVEGRNANGGGNLPSITIPNSVLNTVGLKTINRPSSWNGLAVNYRVTRRSGAGGAQHGEVWLLGMNLKNQ